MDSKELEELMGKAPFSYFDKLEVIFMHVPVLESYLRTIEQNQAEILSLLKNKDIDEVKEEMQAQRIKASDATVSAYMNTMADIIKNKK